jgi:hypothetical protein
MPLGLGRAGLTYQAPAGGGGFTEARASAALRTVDLGGTSLSSTGGKFDGHAFKQGEGSDIIQVYPVDTNWDFESDKPWTVEYWFKISNANYSGHNGTLGGIDFGPPTGVSHRLVSGVTGQRITLSGVTVDISHSTDWRHYAFVNNGTGTAKFYLNGVLQLTKTSFSLTLTGTARHRWYYGSTSGAFNQPTYSWDELRISNNERYTANFTPQTVTHVNDGNTLGLFHFDNNYNDDNNL